MAAYYVSSPKDSFLANQQNSTGQTNPPKHRNITSQIVELQQQRERQAVFQPSLARAFSFEAIATPEHQYDDSSKDDPSDLEAFVNWPDSRQNTLDEYTSSLQVDLISDSLAEPLPRPAHSLPSPQLTNAPTPEVLDYFTPAIHTDHEQPDPSQMPSIRSKSPSPLMLRTHMQEPYGSGHSQVVSPVEIRIQTVSRGDSPARDGLSLSRAGSVRGKRMRSVSADRTAPPQSPSLLSPPAERQDSDDEDDVTERAGVVPDRRGHQEVLGPEDLAAQRRTDDRNEDIVGWIAGMSIHNFKTNISRSHSTGTRDKRTHEAMHQQVHLPERGAMLDEEDVPTDSDDVDDGVDWPDEDDNSVVPQRIITEQETMSPTYMHPPEPVPPARPFEPLPQTIPDEEEEEDPLPSRFFRKAPWQDPVPVTKPEDDGVRFQPQTSAQALYEFERRAKQWDTASRAATWGTGRRRMSDSDSMTSDLKTRHMSLTKRTREQGQQILHRFDRAKQSLIRRTSSHNKKNSQSNVRPSIEKMTSPDPSQEQTADAEVHTSNGSFSSLTRIKSPSHSHRNSHSSSIIVRDSVQSTDLPAVEEHENFLAKVIRRARSSSNVNKSPRSPQALQTLLADKGGIPLPLLGHNYDDHGQDESLVTSPPVEARLPVQDVLQVRLDLTPQTANIVPTFDGFKSEIRRLNPRLEPYLLDRLAQDQLKRYKRLVRLKVEHAQHTNNATCPAEHLCSANGGAIEQLPSRLTARDNPQTAFVVSTNNDSEPDESNFDGNVSSALFPPGIPLPPAKKLPARFECVLCYGVKSFQKPSDWTKHVHEDVQPFTCTFRDCSEPKSFKRKADWVRHENERHWKLEGWRCNVAGCSHVCHRKDNFVQHLVREHKMKEPKIKTKASMSSRARAKLPLTPQLAEDGLFWDVVEQCHHHLQKEAGLELCKFCQCSLPTWKKLSVHVGKHMEQIAMPVIELVEARTVDRHTIISPVEPLPLRSHQQFVHEHHAAMIDNQLPIPSPFSNSGRGSTYHSSSAEQSPAMAVMRPNGNMTMATGYMDQMGDALFATTTGSTMHSLLSTTLPDQDYLNRANRGYHYSATPAVPYLTMEMQMPEGYVQDSTGQTLPTLGTNFRQQNLNGSATSLVYQQQQQQQQQVSGQDYTDYHPHIMSGTDLASTATHLVPTGPLGLDTYQTLDMNSMPHGYYQHYPIDPQTGQGRDRNRHY